MDLISVRTVRTPSHRDDLTAALAEGGCPLAGGTWLFSEEQPGLTSLVDLTALGWPDVERSPGVLRIAATCTIAALLRLDPDPGWAAWPLLDRCANALLASFKVWNSATVGGNVGVALPAGAITAFLVTLEATAVVWTPDGGERRVPVADLVLDVRALALDPHEVIRAFEVPQAALAATTGYRRVSLSPHGRSGALVTARWSSAGFVLVVTAATPRPLVLRFPDVPTIEVLDAALGSHDDWYNDPHGSPAWRRAVSTRFAHELRDEAASVTTAGGAA